MASSTGTPLAPPADPPSAAPSARLDVLGALAREQSAFAALAAQVDPGTALATCPGWTAGDLVRHVTAVHRWAAAAAAGDASAELPDDGPFQTAARAEDLTAAAAALRSALGDPCRPCATLVGPGTAAWWARRQLHETSSTASTSPSPRRRAR